MVLQEGAPGLRGWLAAAHHVLGDAGLADVDAEFKQFAVNARCTPSGILSAHLADRVSNLTTDAGASGLSLASLPSPKPAKPPTMPGHNRFRLDHDQHRAPIAAEAG